jgi:hypothetical protein
VRRTVVPLLIVALTAGGATIATGSSGRSQPRLRLVSAAPLKVRGTAFYPRERVRVTASTGAGVVLRRQVRTTAQGAFVATFAQVVYDPCNSLRVTALGARGDRAVVKRPMRECAPRL